MLMSPVRLCAGNVLLLKNVISLNPDAGEVSQQKLLSLVAERLIDPNIAGQVRLYLLQDRGFVFGRSMRDGLVLGCSSSLPAGI
jgi:hypothetical protein